MTETESWASTHRVKTSLPAEHRNGQAKDRHPMATCLGLFSIGLGLAETLTPRRFARLIGVRYDPTLVQAYGVREIASGIGILAGRPPAAWLWGRVAGDVMDLATLGPELNDAAGERRGRVRNAILAVAGVTLVDAVCAGCCAVR